MLVLLLMVPVRHRPLEKCVVAICRDLFYRLRNPCSAARTQAHFDLYCAIHSTHGTDRRWRRWLVASCYCFIQMAATLIKEYQTSWWLTTSGCCNLWNRPCRSICYRSFRRMRWCCVNWFRSPKANKNREIYSHYLFLLEPNTRLVSEDMRCLLEPSILAWHV